MAAELACGRITATDFARLDVLAGKVVRLPGGA